MNLQRMRYLRQPPVMGALAMAVIILAALAVQHLRHGWPFSLHHGLPSVTATEVSQSPLPATGAIDRHARAEVQLAPVQQAAAGLRLEVVRRETVTRSVRAVAIVVPDERRVWHAHTRVAGWIEQLFVATTGEMVRAGQPLAGIFSQDLYASQLEYLAALTQAELGPRSAVVAGARARLEVLGMTETEIAEIERSGQARRLVTVASPHDGVVLRRAVSVGTAVDPSTELLTVADLSTVWIFAEVPEADAAQIAPGMPVVLDFSAAGLTPFEEVVDFVYPTLSERTRSVRVRFVVANPDGKLRPGLYGTALFRSPPREAITVPRDAVVDTGLMQHVFVASGDGRFEPRAVTLGVRMTERIEIVAGLTEGESLVAAGVFLLDSESRLRGGTGVGHAGHGSPADDPAPAPHQGH